VSHDNARRLVAMRREKEACGKRREAGKISPVATILLMFLTTSVLLCTKPLSVDAASGRVIDLFTQKEPFSGRGINQSSDAFEPQELVILYALVTYNGYPVASALVSFRVNGPANPFQNITTMGSSFTNQSGIAMFSFRLPWPSENPEEITFGEWSALASVSIADQVVIDTLTFRVGWIVRITNIKTLDAEFSPQNRYLRQDVIVFNLTLENIALTDRPGTITVDARDVAGHPIIHTEISNLVFRPGENYVLGSSQVQITATIGPATVSAAVYKAAPESGGALYSPAISSAFEIITVDIAVTAVKLSKTIVKSGEVVEITVSVRNKGNETETFNVTIYRNHTLIDVKRVVALAPSSETEILFEWNTTGVPPGTYVITAVAGPVKGQIEVTDNTLVDGTVTILSYTPLLFFQWWMFFVFVMAVMATLVLLFLLYYLMRRRKRPLRRVYTVIVHPRI
jgi:hypothetical protein